MPHRPRDAQQHLPCMPVRHHERRPPCRAVRRRRRGQLRRRLRRQEAERRRCQVGGTRHRTADSAQASILVDTFMCPFRSQCQRSLHLQERQVQKRDRAVLRQGLPADLLHLHRLLPECGPEGQEHDAPHMGRPQMVHHILRRRHPVRQTQRLLPGLPLHHRPRHMGRRSRQIRLRGA